MTEFGCPQMAQCDWLDVKIQFMTNPVHSVVDRMLKSKCCSFGTNSCLEEAIVIVPGQLSLESSTIFVHPLYEAEGLSI